MNFENVSEIVKKIIEQEFPLNREEALRIALSCIDLTTLEGSDNEQKIQSLCNQAKEFSSLAQNLSNCAAVCVYPVFVRQAKSILKGSGVKVACVAGAFPSGQSPLDIRLKEIEFAVNEGADEVDIVISRGKLLEKKYDEVKFEISKAKELCKNITLKVILETGELQNLENIAIASQLAIDAGADFIKTSTGKIGVSATYESVYVMCEVIKEYFIKTGIRIKLKPAGGISDNDTAINYLKIANHVLGKDWLNNNMFRFGASRLATKIVEELSGKVSANNASAY